MKPNVVIKIILDAQEAYTQRLIKRLKITNIK